MTKYTVWSLDVWGNVEDGFDDNDRSKITESFEMNADIECGQLYKQLSALTGTPAENMIMSNQSDIDMMFIDDVQTGEPMYQIDKNDESGQPAPIATWLPCFPGFYETALDLSNDPDIEHTLFDDPGSESQFKLDWYSQNVWDYIDNEDMETAVSKKCCGFIAGALKDIFGFCEITFGEVVSPKEYNFKTDSVNCDIAINPYVVRQYCIDHLADYENFIKQTYTSQSGFWSRYPNNIKYWLDMENIKSAHGLGSVLQFVLGQEHPDNDLYFRMVEAVRERVYLGEFIRWDELDAAYQEHTPSFDFISPSGEFIGSFQLEDKISEDLVLSDMIDCGLLSGNGMAFNLDMSVERMPIEDIGRNQLVGYLIQKTGV